MNIDEDTSTWLGCPTPLEMYKHQCALLEDELNETLKRLSDARRNIAGLVQMGDLLATGKALAEVALKKAAADLADAYLENSLLGRQVNSLMIVAEQRDQLLVENQRLLTSLKKVTEPQP